MSAIHARAPRLGSAALTLLGVALVSACGSTDRSPDRASNRAAQVAVVVPATTTADSVYAPAVLIARFRAATPEHPARLDDASPRDVPSLLAAYARGVERADSASLTALTLTRGEFAWLYYLDSPMAQKPYELDPDVMWQQMRARGDRGLSRALASYGGHSLGSWRPECGPPRASGSLALYDCAVLIPASATTPARRLRLSVVELGGRFKLASLATSL